MSQTAADIIADLKHTLAAKKAGQHRLVKLLLAVVIVDIVVAWGSILAIICCVFAGLWLQAIFILLAGKEICGWLDRIEQGMKARLPQANS